MIITRNGKLQKELEDVIDLLSFEVLTLKNEGYERGVDNARVGKIRRINEKLENIAMSIRGEIRDENGRVLGVQG